MSSNPLDDFTVIAYTRKQAVADGEQILLNGEFGQIAKDLGFTIPIYVTRLAWADAVAWEDDGHSRYGQSETGRLHDVMSVLRMTINGARRGARHLKFSVQVVEPNGSRAVKTLYAEVGPADIDDPSPAMTIMVSDDL